MASPGKIFNRLNDGSTEPASGGGVAKKAAWRVVVLLKPSFVDHAGKALEREWRHAGLPAVTGIRAGQAYDLSGALSQAEAERLARELLADPITQAAEVSPAGGASSPSGARRALVWPKPGVADPVAGTVAVGARDLGVQGLAAVRSGDVYDFKGTASPADVRAFCENFLMNPLVQTVEVL